MTVIIQKIDDQSHSHVMLQSRKEEIQNLINLTTFKVVLKRDIPTDAYILRGKFFLSLKSTIGGHFKNKDRF